MNQYEQQNAAEKIAGYLIPTMPPVPLDVAFENARAECAGHLRRQLEHVESLTLETYRSVRRLPSSPGDGHG